MVHVFTMTRRMVWILFICFHVQAVRSETPDELLLALKPQYSQQPDCTPMFEIRHPGYISPNATDYPTITTDEECRSSCIRDKKCMSYQVDTRPGETFCRIQSSYLIENLDGPLNAADVKEYVFTVKCVNSTSKEPCAPLIEIRLRNWNSHLAREQPSAKTEMECREICLKDQDCMSYQIDSRPTSPLCYMQKDLEVFNKYQLFPTEDLKEYFVVDRCLDKYVFSYNKDCSPIFKRLFKLKQVSKMATPYPYYTTEQLCRLACLFATDCVSYQIDRNPGASFCSIQTNINNLMQDKLIKADLITEYILVNPCTNRPFDKSAPGCTPFVLLKPYPGVSFGAESHAEVTSADDCRSLCLATSTCVSYQNSSKGILCWTQHNWKNIMPNNGYPTDTVNEYAVARRCSKGPSNNSIVFPDYEVNTPEVIVDECMPSDMRSESDIVFAISIAGILKRHMKSEERLRTLKTFLSNIVVSLNVASNKDRIALVTFERKPYVEFNLNSYNDPKLITEAIAKVVCHECNATEAGVISALHKIKMEVLSYANGCRPNVPHLILIITDRLPAIDLVALNTLMKDLASADTYIIPIGVTDMVEEDQLKGFASPKSDGSPQNLLWVNSFASLNTVVYRIHDAILQVLPKKYLRPCLK